jgi:hypothetical protein
MKKLLALHKKTLKEVDIEDGLRKILEEDQEYNEERLMDAA